MTDLTYCYSHMTEHDLKTLDTWDIVDYMDLQPSDEELEIPPHMVPPDPDDSEILPSHVHPSYPYGNPTNLKHPAALPNAANGPIRALYQDVGRSGGNVNSTLRWKELGLDLLLPVNQAREDATRAAVARKMASGAAQNHLPGGAMNDQNGGDADENSNEDNEEDDENDEEEDDEDEAEYYENDASRGSFESF